MDIVLRARPFFAGAFDGAAFFTTRFLGVDSFALDFFFTANLCLSSASYQSNSMYKLWGRLFSLRTRFPASPAGRKAGLRPRLAAPQQMQNDGIGKNPGSGTLRIYAPGVETLRLNGLVIQPARG